MRAHCFVRPDARNGISAPLMRQAGFPAIATCSAAIASGPGRWRRGDPARRSMISTMPWREAREYSDRPALRRGARGAAPYRYAMGAVIDAGQRMLAGGMAFLVQPPSTGRLNALLQPGLPPRARGRIFRPTGE